MTERSAALVDEAGPRRWHALSAPLLAAFMSVLDNGIVAVAAPSIQRGLGASAVEVQWAVSGYGLMFGLALIPAGRLGDALGRRRMFVVALSAFVVCSALAGAAPVPEMLVAARLVQGLAAGAPAPQHAALVVQLFPDAERGRAFGVLGASTGIAMALGPVAGGLVLAIAGEPDGWRWIFYLNVPVGTVALLLAVRFVPRGATGPRGRIDLVGAALLGGAVLAVLLPLVRVTSGGIGELWGLFPAAVVLAAAFVGWERRISERGGEPLIDVRLLGSTPGYVFGLAVGTAYFVGFSGVWLVLALFFQGGLGYSPLVSGSAVTSFAVGAAASAVVSGRLAGRLGPLVVVVGLTVVIIGLAAAAVVLVLAPPALTAWALAAPLLVAGIGGGLVIPTNTTMTMRRVPASSDGSAGGVLQTGQRLGAAIGAAAITGVFYAVLDTSGYAAAAAVAVGGAALGVATALVLAVVDARRGRSTRIRRRCSRRRRPAPPP